MRRIYHATLAAAVAIFLSTPSWAQPVRIGSEFQINSYTQSTQAHPSVAVDASGGFVVVWESFVEDGSGMGIFGRRFDGAGNPLMDDFQINTYTPSDQVFPSVAVGPFGDFVAVWESYRQDGSGSGVFGRLFDSAGNPLSGEFRINTYTMNSQAYPSVAANSAGDFVVVWQSEAQDRSSSGVFGRRFDSSLNPLGIEFQANTYTIGFQGKPSVAADSSGNFVVVWESIGQEGPDAGIFGQRFDMMGIPLGSEFQVNTYTMNRQYGPSVAADPSGDFVVVWTSDGQDGSGRGVFGRRFDRSGSPLGMDFQVNAYTTGWQHLPSIARDASGNFVVVWQSLLQDGSDIGIFGRRYNGAGTPLGDEFQVNTFTTGGQNVPSVGGDTSGNFVVAWQSAGQGGGCCGGIYGQRFACSDVDGDGVCDGDDVVVTSPLDGSTLDCRNPKVFRTTITWAPGEYDKYRVSISPDPGFKKGSVVTSGDALLTRPWFTPPPKKWTSACRKAIAANPISSALYIKIYGVDVDASKRDPNRKTFSQIVRAGILH